MSVHFNRVALVHHPKLGIIPEHWEAELRLASAVEPGEKPEVAQRRVFERVYGDLQADFEALLVRLCPDGVPAEGEAAQLVEWIRLKLAGDCNDQARIACAQWHLREKGQI